VKGEHPPLRFDADGPMTVARNVSTRYLAIGIEIIVGLTMLPFNVSHLGQAAYGLWMLAASITAYFSVLDLGYSGATVKFVAKYRAQKDEAALNQILSTTFFLFLCFGTAAYGIAILIAYFIEPLFHLSPADAHIGRVVLLATTANVAASIAFSVFGGVINGFQRYDLNNVVGAATSVVAAVVNVVVLLAGYGLIELVLATTVVRLLALGIYRANAYRVFPGLKLRPSLFSRARLKEVTSFSVFMALIDWANKLNYSLDAVIIGSLLNTSAVAIWSIGQRLAETTLRVSNQLNEVLFPTLVDRSTSRRVREMQSIFLVGTRLSVATVVAVGGTLALMAGPLVEAWVGPRFAGSVIVVRLLALTVIVRVSIATAATLLKAAGGHKLVAYTSLITSFVNLGLSLVLIGPMGLAGVALGTLLPVAFTSLFILLPAGCRRVHLRLRDVLIKAFWPALWPVGGMALFIAIAGPLAGTSLVAVGMVMMGAAFIYAATFAAFGVTVEERRICLEQAAKIFSGRPRLAAKPVSEGA
jgi:O-antigen/teichoic acid export membrane protein